MKKQCMPSILLILPIVLLPIHGMCPSQCSCNDKSVRCSEGTLKNVPHFLNPDIDTLDLSDNTIVKLENGLSFYTELTLVNLSKNSIKSLGRNQFMNQNKVIDLDISSNLVSKIRAGAFNGLESLNKLNMKDNKIEKLGSAVFTGLVNLQKLDLSYNVISEIDNEAFKYLHNLQVLILRKNSLSIFGDWSAPLFNLRFLDISQNLVVRLSETILFNNLEDLNLSDNMIVDISDAAFTIPSLSILDVSYNKLTKFPSVPNLRELIMSGNMIKSLDQNSLQGLPSLQVLRLNNSPLFHSIEPLSFIDCHNLSYLSLSSNRKLSPLPRDIFQTTPKLSVLDISNVLWTSLSPDQVPASAKKIIMSGVPLKCDCSLLWLWELKERGDIVEGAACDQTDLAKVNVDNLACDQVEYLIIVAVVGGVIAVVIVIVIVTALVKCLTNKDGDKYIQCDYLQYNPHGVRYADEKVVSTYIQRSPSKPYYTETDNLAQYVQQSPRKPYFNDTPQVTPYLSRAMYDPNSDSQSPTKMSSNMSEQIYYCVQDPGVMPINLDQTVYSSSGSASSDPNTTSTECSVPNSKSYCSPLVNQSNVEEIMFNTQKKRTLVKYRFPDVLPSEKLNQSYYV